MKRTLAIIIALTMVLALVACGSSNETSDGGNGTATTNSTETDSGIVGIEDYPFDETRKSTANSDEVYPYVSFAQSLSATSWEPYNLQDDAKFIGVQMIYEYLLDYVGPNEFAGRLAKNWYEEDDTHVVVELYDYIHDSEGNPITADDVVFSYKLNVDSGYAYNFEYYENVEKVDDYTVRFTWNAPLANLQAFQYLLANVAIVSETAYETHDFSNNPIGTGPYVMTQFVTDAYAEFEINDNYWQTEELQSDLAAQNVQTIHLDFVTDASMRLIMLENGTSVGNTSLAATDISAFLEGGEHYGEFNVVTLDQSWSQTLVANVSENSVMSDINMRLACWYAISSDAIQASLGANAYGKTIVDVSPAVADYQDEWNDIVSYQTVYDVDLAKQYLEKSNYNGETIQILAGTWDVKSKAALVVQNMLEEIGVKCEISVVEHVLLESMRADDTAWDIYVNDAGYSDYTINRLYEIYAISNGKVENYNTFFLHDDTLEAMLQECIDPDTYSPEKTGEILQYIIDNGYGYGTCYAMSYMAWNKCVAKVVMPYVSETKPLLNCCDYYLD